MHVRWGLINYNVTQVVIISNGTLRLEIQTGLIPAGSRSLFGECISHSPSKKGKIKRWQLLGINRQPPDLTILHVGVQTEAFSTVYIYRGLWGDGGCPAVVCTYVTQWQRTCSSIWEQPWVWFLKTAGISFLLFWLIKSFLKQKI